MGVSALGLTVLAVWLLAVAKAYLLGAMAAFIPPAMYFVAIRSARAIPALRRDLREGEKERFVATIEALSISGGSTDYDTYTSAHGDVTIEGEEYRIDSVAASRYEEGDFVLIERAVHSRALLWMEPTSGEDEAIGSSSRRLLSTADD